jgi:hypothetical protein
MPTRDEATVIRAADLTGFEKSLIENEGISLEGVRYVIVAPEGWGAPSKLAQGWLKMKWDMGTRTIGICYGK